MIIKNAHVFTENGFIVKDIYTDGDRISLSPKANAEIIDAENLYAIPGLIDLHFHGCMGYDFCDGTQEAIQAIADYEAGWGVTSIAPATMSFAYDTLERIFQNAASYRSIRGAGLVGINMEGPYLNPAKKGAHNEAFLMAPELAHFRAMQQLSEGLIKLLAIAPEVAGAMDFIKALRDEVVISAAHTFADYDTAVEAFRNGASNVTHLYNAMPAFSHRSPGVIGAALDTDHVKVELICDGIHVAPSVVRATFKMFGDDRIILISDSMMATGLEDGEYSLGGQKVQVSGSKATLMDGTLAGSTTNLMLCMKTAVSMGIPLISAVKCASVNPAKQLGIYEEYGSLTPGKYADIVLLNPDLTINRVILKGKIFPHIKQS
jgi:N-acetylglucosamine-6-phosphate deacetylase